jgi:hypothetical protein
VTEHELFSFTKGENTPIGEGAYSCNTADNKPPSVEGGLPSTVLNNLLRHSTTFQGVIEVTAVKPGSAVRYLVTSKDDPTSGSVYAFHALGNDIFAYALPSYEGAKQVIQFARIRGNSIESMATRNGENEAIVAQKHGITQSGDANLSRFGSFMMRGSPPQEISFLRELAQNPDTFFEVLSVCTPVNG